MITVTALLEYLDLSAQFFEGGALAPCGAPTPTAEIIFIMYQMVFKAVRTFWYLISF